jgi:translation initiation factor 6 (eIF-6)
MAITREEAFRKNYLQKKKVYLRPVVRGGKMVSSSNHIAYFQMEGAKNWFQLPVIEQTGVLANPFTSDEEKEFFDKLLDTDLSIHRKKDNFWHTFFVKVIKDYNLMHDGYAFDLSDPLDNLKYRVTKLQPFVAPSWDQRLSRGEYRFALVDEGYQQEKEETTTNKTIEAYTYFGSIQNSLSQMKDFLGVYYLEKKEMKFVPEDADKEWLKKEIKKVIEHELDLALKIINDPYSKIKNTILKAMVSGAIVKSARNKYDIPGEGVSYTYDELVQYLSKAEEVKADVYLKILAQNELTK